MALLTISAVTASTSASDTGVRVELTDVRGTPFTGFDLTGDPIIDNALGQTGNDGTISFDLVPNLDISPIGSYYTVTVGSKSFLITKGSGTESLIQALV